MVHTQTFGRTNNEYYQYNLDILFNNKKIDSNIFSDVNKKVLWSKTYAASFMVKKVNNYYLLKSMLGKQVNGEYIIVLDNNGNIVNSFSDVTSELKDNTLLILKCVVDKDCYYDTFGVDKVELN